MDSGAGLAGNIAGQAAQAIGGGFAVRGAGLAGQLGQGYGATAASGAAQGLLQPLNANQDEGDRLLNAGVGMGAGILGRGVVSGGGNLLRRGAGAVAGSLLPKASPEVADLAKTAIKDYGIPLKAS